ncbi:FecR family protein [Flavobacterium sp. RHBU_3]|uniref:FecR family protein n=1 Tax=Flavobacterium sp. RHBU_3 TaxID=3391184 RepID=UPI00398515CE
MEDVKLAKWLNDEMDAQELKEFESLPEYATYSKIKQYSAELEAPQADMEAMYARIQQHKLQQNQPKVRRLNAWFGRVAAVLLIAVGISVYMYAARVTTQAAVAGATNTFLLPDDSEISLNADSEAEYKTFNWDNNRRLELNGEAYFKAAKGKTFDVVTPQGTVTVVGTRFDVKVRGKRLDVTCYEGKVRVTTKNETVLLTPGKAVAYEDGNNLHVPDVKKEEPGWVNRHEVDFSIETPENVLAELERQFNVKISVQGKLKDKGGYSGTLPVKNLEATLDMFSLPYGLKYKKQGKEIILSAE